jgi:hypothetical protein
MLSLLRACLYEQGAIKRAVTRWLASHINAISKIYEIRQIARFEQVPVFSAELFVL